MTLSSDVLIELKNNLNKYDKFSAMLRDIYEKFGLNRRDLADMVLAICDEVQTADIQAIWAWDMNRNGNGYSDSYIDEHLAHLLQFNRKGGSP